MAGRPPKSAHEKRLEGNPGKRDIPDNPVPDRKAPPCPPFLSDNAKLEWYRLVDDMAERGVLTSWDMSPYATYCQLYGRWVEQELQLAKEGMMVEVDFTNKRGDTITRSQINPLLPEIRHTMTLLVKLGQELGITPAARSKVRITPQAEEKNPMNNLLAM